jgi:hypothetical protein
MSSIFMIFVLLIAVDLSVCVTFFFRLWFVLLIFCGKVQAYEMIRSCVSRGGEDPIGLGGMLVKC